MVHVPDSTAWYPEQYGQLIDAATKEKAIAGQVLTPVTCGGYTMSFPILATDPNAGWYAPSSEIALSDAGLNELTVTVKAVKGLTKLSNESANDSSPDLANVIGGALSRQVTAKLDAALFSNTVPVDGAQGFAGYAFTSLDVPGGLTTVANTDKFVQARYDALSNADAHLTHWIIAPDVAKHFATAKVATSDNRALLDHDADGNLVIDGLPALVSRHVAAGEAWGVDRTQAYLVLRQGTTVELDRSAAFSSDSTLVRVVMRAQFACPEPAGIVRLWDDPAVI